MEATGPAAVAVVQAIQATAVGKPPVGGTTAADQQHSGSSTAQEPQHTKQTQKTGQAGPTSEATLEDEPGETEGAVFICTVRHIHTRVCIQPFSVVLPTCCC